MTPTGKALVRTDDRMIAGVVAGIAHYFGWPVTPTRVAYVLISVLSAAFPGIVVYGLLWLVMPDESRSAGRF